MLITGNDTDKTASQKQDTVSVVIVTYNAAATLQTCLDSIFKQTYPAIELVIIDGKSNDGTVAILEQNASRINYWVSEKDKGIYDAMNKALKHLTGQWVYFLGADDFLFDDFSAMCYELTDRSAIYYGRVMCDLGPTFEMDTYGFAKHGICHQAMIYPREVFDEGRTFDLRYHISADYAFNMALYNSGKYHFEFRDHLVANFNQTGVSSTSTDLVFEQDRAAMVRKYFGTKIWLRFLFWRLKKKLKGKG